MQRDAGATRARILASAITEFAAHGHAGARVDRIAMHAESNVRMIYAYFVNKSGLFDAAFAEAIARMAAAVPPRPGELDHWVGEIFDFHERSPETLRLSMWAQLERPEAASEPLESYLSKIEAVDDATSGFTSVDLLVIIYAIAQAWHLAPIGLVAADPTASTASRRAAAVRAVSRLVTGAS